MASDMGSMTAAELESLAQHPGYIPGRFAKIDRSVDSAQAFSIRFIVVTYAVGEWSAFMGRSDMTDDAIRLWGQRVPLELARLIWPMEMFHDYHR